MWLERQNGKYLSKYPLILQNSDDEILLHNLQDDARPYLKLNSRTAYYLDYLTNNPQEPISGTWLNEFKGIKDNWFSII